MDATSKVWNTTRTGFKVHAFKDGDAMCRKSIQDTCPAPAHTHSTARRWVLDTPGLSFCESCEYAFNFRVSEDAWMAERVEAAHAEALEINDDEEDDMTTKEGPLTERQTQILRHTMNGLTQKEIARETGLPLSTIGQDNMYAVRKFKCHKVSQAIGCYATALAYQKAAVDLLSARVPVPIDDAEAHVNHVLEDLARMFEDRAARMMPK